MRQRLKKFPEIDDLDVIKYVASHYIVWKNSSIIIYDLYVLKYTKM